MELKLPLQNNSMKAKILIKNGFIGGNKKDEYILSCELIDGKINKKDNLFYSEVNIGWIKDLNLTDIGGKNYYQITFHKIKDIKIANLYGHVISVQ